MLKRWYIAKYSLYYKKKDYQIPTILLFLKLKFKKIEIADKYSVMIRYSLNNGVPNNVGGGL